MEFAYGIALVGVQGCVRVPIRLYGYHIELFFDIEDISPFYYLNQEIFW